MSRLNEVRRSRAYAAAAGFCAVALMAAGAAASAQALKLPKADVEYDHDTDFTALRTFQWREGQDPLPNPTRNMAMVSAIERELEKKGLRKATEGKADVQVRFYVSLDKHLRGAARQSESPYTVSDLRTSVDIEKMAEGTVIVELYQGDTDMRIWRGSTTKVFRASALDEEIIRSSVSLILRGYPPTSSPKP